MLKRDGSVRICGDYKVTINKVSRLEQYPIPRIEDLYTKLSGGKKYTKLDMSNAYLQVELDDTLKRCTTINKHMGLFEYNILPMGIASSPAIFQRKIDTVLQGLSGVVAYMDDLLVTGANDEEHSNNLREVLSRLSEAGIHLRLNKCVFEVENVEYLGYMIDEEGIHPVEKAIKAIEKLPRPTSVTELKSFLRLINYYRRFLPNLAHVLAPLHKLLQKDSEWLWTDIQDKAFLAAKSKLQSSTLLVRFDSDKELILTCDASPYGLGAVLSHIMEDGSEKPINFAFRSLAPAEKNYSQLEKETLAIVFGVKKFHSYLFGHHFTHYSVHKPLEGLLGEYRGIRPTSSGRIQRWALTLSAYEYNFHYKPGKNIPHADALSRLPQDTSLTEIPVPMENILLMETLNQTPITFKKIASGTNKDPVCAAIRRCVLTSWPDYTKTKYPEFYLCRNELSVEEGCILRGSRVVVPPQYRAEVVKLIHEGHPGIVNMKRIAREFVWWPGIDSELERKVKTCEPCQQSRGSPPASPLSPWIWPNEPWSRLHLDFAGPIKGQKILIIVDAHSKWIDTHVMTTTTSEATVDRLRQTFSKFGLPSTVVTDNGTPFTGVHFQQFMEANGVKHITSAPFHPSSNGLAERAVQSVKKGISKLSEGTLEVKLSKVLFRYRTTPHSTTGKSPSELLFGRRIRTHLDLLHPDQKGKVIEKQHQ